ESEKTPTPPITKSTSKKKRTQSVASSSIRRSQRVASSSAKLTIDTTVLSISDDDSEDKNHDQPQKTNSPAATKTHSKKAQSSKSISRPSRDQHTSSDKEEPPIKSFKKSTPLIPEENLEKFKSFSQHKLILPGRLYDFDNLLSKGINLAKFTDYVGLTDFFKIRETYYPNLISAFYFSAAVHSDRDLISSNLKGRIVKITENHISKLLNLPQDGHKVYGSSWFQMLGIERSNVIASMFEEGSDLKDPPSSRLKHEYKLLHNMCLHSIFPRKGSKDKVTDNDLLMMHHMGNGIKINLPYVMLQHMIHTIESGTKRMTLPYGMFLTRFFRKYKVSLDGEEGQNSAPVFSSRNVERMKNLNDQEEKEDAGDHGKKRKKDAFEEKSNLEDLADIATAQKDNQKTFQADSPIEDHQETIPSDPPVADKGKSVSTEPFASPCTFSTTIPQQVNESSFVSMHNVSTNPINTSTFSPVMSSQKTFESSHHSDFIRNVLNSPFPTYAGPSMPSFPLSFNTLSTFCTNVSSSFEPNHDTPMTDPPQVPNPETRPPEKSSLEKDVAKIKKCLPNMFAAMNAQNSAMQYMLAEWQALRTWIGNTYNQALPENTLPLPNFVFPNFESDSDDPPPTKP
ncbi:hypothetical protein A2U01_0001594, partial [Trifolium medium]|nr:hypothetical protein [Trifolium medium]